MSRETQLTVLLRDFGYRMEGRTLYRKGIKGYLAEERVGRFRNVLDAAEWLAPIIADAEYTRRLLKDEPGPHDERFERIATGLEMIEGFKGLELQLIMRHLKLALTCQTGQFILRRISSYATQRTEDNRGVRLDATCYILRGPNFDKEIEARFRFSYDGHKFKSQMEPVKQGGSESNHRDKTCKRKQMKREGRRAKINIEELFT